MKLSGTGEDQTEAPKTIQEREDLILFDSTGKLIDVIVSYNHSFVLGFWLEAHYSQTPYLEGV